MRPLLVGYTRTRFDAVSSVFVDLLKRNRSAQPMPALTGRCPRAQGAPPTRLAARDVQLLVRSDIMGAMNESHGAHTEVTFKSGLQFGLRRSLCRGRVGSPTWWSGAASVSKV